VGANPLDVDDGVIANLLMKDAKMSFSDTVNKTIMKGVESDPELIRKIESDIGKLAQRAYMREKSATPIIIHEYLTPQEQSKIELEYPEYRFKNEVLTATNAHALAAVRRRCLARRIRDRLQYTRNGVVVNGYDVVIKEVGANGFMLYDDNDDAIHGCMPM